MNTDKTRTARRIIAEGDGATITRTAKQYDARAAIAWTRYDNAPMLELTVSPFGVWELVARNHGTHAGAWTIARGHISDEATTCEHAEITGDTPPTVRT